MKIAVIIACHKDFSLVEKLCSFFAADKDFQCFVHVDQKSSFERSMLSDTTKVVSGMNATDVKWGHFSQVTACLSMLSIANNERFDYYWYMSGQDVPIKDIQFIKSYFVDNQPCSYIDIGVSRHYRKRNLVFYPNSVIGPSFWQKVARNFMYLASFIPGLKRDFSVDFKHGSQWFCLHDSLLSELLRSPVLGKYKDFFRNSFCADESFFQTLISNDFSNYPIKDSLTYMDWSQGLPHPRTLTEKDFECLMASNKLLARKFDLNVDSKIIEKIYSVV